MDQQQKKTLVRARFRNAIQGFGLDIQGVFVGGGDDNSWFIAVLSDSVMARGYISLNVYTLRNPIFLPETEERLASCVDGVVEEVCTLV